MAIDVHPKPWATSPPVSARAVTGHPLCPRHGWLIDGGAAVDAVRGLIAAPTGGTWSAHAVRGAAMRARQHTATSDALDLGAGDVILPTAAGCSVVMAYFKTDATNRNAVALTVNHSDDGGTTAFNVHLPWQDGKVYWQYGGAAEGSTRLSYTAAAYGNDLWVFTTGPRGMEAWQNGALGASNGGNPTRTNAGQDLILGNAPNFSRPGDLFKCGFVFIYDRQLGLHEIAEVTLAPFAWVSPRS